MKKIVITLACASPVYLFVMISCLTPSQVKSTVEGGIDVTICILNHSNEPPPQILKDCGAVSLEDVIKVIDAHKAAEVREGFVIPPSK